MTNNLRNLKARAAILVALAMTAADMAPAAAAIKEPSREEAVTDQKRAEDYGKEPATRSDAEMMEEQNFFQDLVSEIFWKDKKTLREGQYGDGVLWSLDEDGVMIFSGEGELPDYTGENAIPWYPYKNDIEEVIFEDGITSIGAHLFAGYRYLRAVELPDSVNHIGERAFWNCASLSQVELPDTVLNIDGKAFGQCPLLSDEIPVSRGLLGENVKWNLDRGGVLALEGEGPMPDGTDWTDFQWYSCFDMIQEIDIGEGLTTIGAYAFDSCEKVSHVSLPEGITVIGESAFAFCDGLVSVELPDTLTRIGAKAFCGCKSLTGVTIPDGVKRIDSNAFYGCESLTDVVIPDSVTTIVGGAFSKCPNLSGAIPIAKDTYDDHLRWVMTSDGVLTVSGDRDIPDMGQSYIIGVDPEPPYGGKNWNINWCREDLKKLVIEDGITAIGRSAFASCKNLVSVELPESVTKIGENAFNYCLSLAHIEFPENLRRIERKAFTDTAITSAFIPKEVQYLDQMAFSKETELVYEKMDHMVPVPIEESEGTGFVSTYNAHGHYYHSFPQKTVWSYLWTGETGNLFRTEYSQERKQVVTEEYDPEYQLLRSWEIPMELPVFGGFYEEEEYFYIVFGQKNLDEQDDKEVVRVVKYSKGMERLDSASFYGLGTTNPFASGSLRMDKRGPNLYIHTSHIKYTSRDGVRHQENMSLVVNTDAMVASLEDYGRTEAYVSHSFNQFIKVSGDQVITIDHGDGFPARAVIMGCHQAEDMGGTPLIRRNIYPIKGEFGENYTGLTLGGLELSDSSYLIAGASIDQENFEESYIFNVFLRVIKKDEVEDTKKLKKVQVTDYDEGGTTCGGNPMLTKISDNLFALMWETVYSASDKKYMVSEWPNLVNVTFIDGEGDQLCGVKTFEGNLSDCQPIVHDGQVTWYVTDRKKLTFYTYPAEYPEDIEDLEIRKTVLDGQKDGQDGSAGSGSDTEKPGDEGTSENGDGGESGTGKPGSEGAEGTGQPESGAGESGDKGTGGTEESGTGTGGDYGNPGEGGSENGEDDENGDHETGDVGEGTEGSGEGGSGSDGTGGIGGGLGIGGSEIGGTGGSGGSGGGNGGSGGSGSSGSSGSGGPGGNSGGSSGSGSSKETEGVFNGSPAAPGNDEPGSGAVLTGTWRRDIRGWWLEKPDKSYPQNQWARINGAVYRFDHEGYMVEGWILLSDRWYYLTPDSGAMATGWVWISDRWYYLRPDGVMATGWIQMSGIWYYLNTDGAMATGWIQVGGKWYYLNPDGAMAANTRTPDGYMVGADGAWIR